jgi:hypothetical protein
MTMPGVMFKINQFSGPLAGQLAGPNGTIGVNNGSALGSFARKGDDAAAGVIGNWHAIASGYKATGVFGASRNGPISVVGR